MAHPVLPLLLIALVVAVLFTNIVAAGFAKLGLPRAVVLAVFAASLAGSVINIPVWRRNAAIAPEQLLRMGMLLFYQPPATATQLVAVNIGGALVPVGLSLWLVSHATWWKLLLAVLIVALIAHAIARVEPGTGITMPTFVAPIAAGALGWLLAGGGGKEAAGIAYVGGTLGTLLGADLLNLRRLERMGPGIVSIGGAGVFDGVFIVGVIAALLA